MKLNLNQGKMRSLEEGHVEHDYNNEDSGINPIERNNKLKGWIWFMKVLFYLVFVLFILLVGWIGLVYFTPTSSTKRCTMDTMDDIDCRRFQEIMLVNGLLESKGSNSIRVKAVSWLSMLNDTMASTESSRTDADELRLQLIKSLVYPDPAIDEERRDESGSTTEKVVQKSELTTLSDPPVSTTNDPNFDDAFRMVRSSIPDSTMMSTESSKTIAESVEHDKKNVLETETSTTSSINEIEEENEDKLPLLWLKSMRYPEFAINEEQKDESDSTTEKVALKSDLMTISEPLVGTTDDPNYDDTFDGDYNFDGDIVWPSMEDDTMTSMESSATNAESVDHDKHKKNVLETEALTTSSIDEIHEENEDKLPLLWLKSMRYPEFAIDEEQKDESDSTTEKVALKSDLMTFSEPLVGTTDDPNYDDTFDGDYNFDGDIVWPSMEDDTMTSMESSATNAESVDHDKHKKNVVETEASTTSSIDGIHEENEGKLPLLWLKSMRYPEFAIDEEQKDESDSTTEKVALKSDLMTMSEPLVGTTDDPNYDDTFDGDYNFDGDIVWPSMEDDTMTSMESSATNAESVDHDKHKKNVVETEASTTSSIDGIHEENEGKLPLLWLKSMRYPEFAIDEEQKDESDSTTEKVVRKSDLMTLSDLLFGTTDDPNYDDDYLVWTSMEDDTMTSTESNINYAESVKQDKKNVLETEASTTSSIDETDEDKEDSLFLLLLKSIAYPEPAIEEEQGDEPDATTAKVVHGDDLITSSDLIICSMDDPNYDDDYIVWPSMQDNTMTSTERSEIYAESVKQDKKNFVETEASTTSSIDETDEEKDDRLIVPLLKSIAYSEPAIEEEHRNEPDSTTKKVVHGDDLITSSDLTVGKTNYPNYDDESDPDTDGLHRETFMLSDYWNRDYESSRETMKDLYEDLYSTGDSMDYSLPTDEINPSAPIAKRSITSVDEIERVSEECTATLNGLNKDIDNLTAQVVFGDATDPSIVNLRQRFRDNIIQLLSIEVSLKSDLNWSELTTIKPEPFLRLLTRDVAYSADADYRTQLLTSDFPTKEMTKKFHTIIETTVFSDPNCTSKLFTDRRKHSAIVTENT